MANIKLNKRRQAYMKSLGYNVPTDGSWGPYQQKIWDKLSTKQKEYDNTFIGLFNGLKDKITGNTTYKKDPLVKDQIYKSRGDSYTKPSNGVSKALLGTYIPGAIALASPQTILKHPIASAVGYLGGLAGNTVVDKISKATTKKDFATNVGNTLGISKQAAEYLNPGSYIGGYGAVRRLLNSIYTNVSPLGYGNMLTVKNKPLSTISKKQELLNSIKDYFTPKRINTDNPKWKSTINNDALKKSTIIFRDDAWRLATRQKPHTIEINGKPQSLYIANGDGTYRYNFDYINHVKKMLGEPVDNVLNVNYKHPSVAHDNITTNAGFLNVQYTPQYKQYMGKYIDLGKPKVTINDVWDLQPLKNVNPRRSLFPKFSQFAQQNPNFITNYFRNIEALGAVGGKPFVLKQEIPEGIVQLNLVNSNLPQ